MKRVLLHPLAFAFCSSREMDSATHSMQRFGSTALAVCGGVPLTASVIACSLHFGPTRTILEAKESQNRQRRTLACQAHEVPRHKRLPPSPSSEHLRVFNGHQVALACSSSTIVRHISSMLAPVYVRRQSHPRKLVYLRCLSQSSTESLSRTPRNARTFFDRSFFKSVPE